MTITVPAAFAATLAAEAGTPALTWLDELLMLVDACLARWDLTVDGAVLHGNAAVVVPVRRAGAPAVLKVSWPHDEAEHEALALSTWDGAGAVRLLAHDRDAWALLLERLDPHTSLLGEPIDAALAVAGDLVRRLDRPAPPGLRGMAAVAARWTREFPTLRDVPAELVGQAVAYCRELGPKAGDRLVNADLHYANVLRGDRAPWLLIDPKPIAGDQEFGLIPLLWNRFDESTPHSRLAGLVLHAGLDLELARRWTFVRAVDGWLDHGEDDWLGAACARIATALA
jgi:streptomycin 6-kinase